MFIIHVRWACLEEKILHKGTLYLIIKYNVLSIHQFQGSQEGSNAILMICVKFEGGRQKNTNKCLQKISQYIEWILYKYKRSYHKRQHAFNGNQ